MKWACLFLRFAAGNLAQVRSVEMFQRIENR